MSREDAVKAQVQYEGALERERAQAALIAEMKARGLDTTAAEDLYRRMKRTSHLYRMLIDQMATASAVFAVRRTEKQRDASSADMTVGFP